MPAWIDVLNSVARIWGDRLWAVLWQSTLLAVVAALAAALLLRRSAPAVRYWVWQILAFKMLAMPFWTWAVPLPQSVARQSPDPTVAIQSVQVPVNANAPEDDPTTGASIEPAPSTASAPRSLLTESLWPRLSWQSWLFVGWLCVVAAQLLRLFRQRQRLNRLLVNSNPASDELTDLVRQTAGRLELPAPPRTVLTGVDCSPFVCGVRRAVLVLPQGLVESLTAPQLTQVLLHELAHVRRKDLIWGWIGEAARIVYFFHPVVHWITYRSRLERELACDQLAMRFSGNDAAAYAATLVHVVSHASQPASLTAAAANLDGGIAQPQSGAGKTPPKRP